MSSSLIKSVISVVIKRLNTLAVIGTTPEKSPLGNW